MHECSSQVLGGRWLCGGCCLNGFSPPNFIAWHSPKNFPPFSLIQSSLMLLRFWLCSPYTDGGENIVIWTQSREILVYNPLQAEGVTYGVRKLQILLSFPCANAPPASRIWYLVQLGFFWDAAGTFEKKNKVNSDTFMALAGCYRVFPAGKENKLEDSEALLH